MTVNADPTEPQQVLFPDALSPDALAPEPLLPEAPSPAGVPSPEVLSPDELLTTTRSVRRRLDPSRPLDLALVKECVEIAQQAPNGGNTQRWHWLVVADPELRCRIAAVYRRAFEARNPPADLPAGPPPATPEQGAHARMMASGRHLADRLHEIPVLVIPCLRLSGKGLPEGSQAGLWGSLLPAAWSYMLAARARGLGTAWTTAHLDAEQEVAALLGLPEDVRQGALIPTAHVLGDGFRPAPRRPVESVLHLDGWDGAWGGGLDD
ncbi:nitroreductase family protein [Streptomyces sp. NPDC089799]|uniref:nitroreductase family protein n=1 Tax=Streptomyces sp. NPDC089799 TaxID=3155066 RepID=UPI003421879C